MQSPYTNKATEALQSAQQLATESGHPELMPAHLALALLAQPEGLMAALLQKLEADPKVLAGELALVLDKLPRAEGSQLAPSRAFGEVMNEAAAAAKRLEDEFVSTEHFLLALAKRGGPEVMGLFDARNLSAQRLEAALTELRGEKRVTSPDPESTFDALQKYARDLTEDARAGKLDPVIGRDTEIRRVMQVLSRRTQEQPRPDRRAGRRQDRHRRGARATGSWPATSPRCSRTSASWPSTWARWSPAPSTAASSRTASRRSWREIEAAAGAR